MVSKSTGNPALQSANAAHPNLYRSILTAVVLAAFTLCVLPIRAQNSQTPQTPQWWDRIGVGSG